jgi:hypothetical protein
MPQTLSPASPTSIKTALAAELRPAGHALPLATDLFTIEQSHDKPRLTQPRPSDLGTVETGADRRQDHNADGTFAAGNKAAADRSAKRALTAPLRAATARVRAVTEGQAPSETDALLADAMAVYSSVRRELGTRRTLVLSAVAVHAAESVLAGYFINRAAAVGLDTKQGAALIEMAHRCETQAARAMTAALAATKALGGRKPKRAKSPVELIEERAAASRNGSSG